MQILGVFLLISFWAAVLAVIPMTLYLLINNIPLYLVDKFVAQGIFILREEAASRRNKKSRAVVVTFIHGLSVVFFFGVYIFNQNHDIAGLNPFDVLLSACVLLFALSILVYLPVAKYLTLKNFWLAGGEICLSSIYVAYGVGILIFSVFFFSHWLKKSNLFIREADILLALLIIALGASLPWLLCIFWQAINHCKQSMPHPNRVFIIYSIFFLILSMAFMVNWMKTGLMQ